MPERRTQVLSPAQAEKVKRAHSILSEIRAALYERLADYVLGHESRIRAETLGDESYAHHLQQMEELFLNRLHVVERAFSELGRQEGRDGAPAATTYEVIEVTARRDDLPQKVADALADHGESDLLDVCVLRADERQAEVMLIMAREDNRPPQAAGKPGEDASTTDDAPRTGDSENDDT